MRAGNNAVKQTEWTEDRQTSSVQRKPDWNHYKLYQIQHQNNIKLHLHYTYNTTEQIPASEKNNAHHVCDITNPFKRIISFYQQCAESPNVHRTTDASSQTPIGALCVQEMVIVARFSWTPFSTRVQLRFDEFPKCRLYRWYSQFQLEGTSWISWMCKHKTMLREFV